MELQNTKTHANLMRALAGETLARNRYELAAETAEREKLPVIAAVFRYTAGQEREHAEVFYEPEGDHVLLLTTCRGASSARLAVAFTMEEV